MTETELKRYVNQAMTALELACELLQSKNCNVEIGEDFDMQFIIEKANNNLMNYFLYEADEKIKLKGK